MLIEKFLIVGLGNNGKKFENTRHNCGFKFIDYFVDFLNNKNISFSSLNLKINSLNIVTIKKFSYYNINKNYQVDFYLLKPSGYINNCGALIKNVFDKLNIKNKNNLIIVYDDIYLKNGIFKLKFEGSDAGHNGLKNLIFFFGKFFVRFKIGVGINEEIDLDKWVLSNFNKEDSILLEKVFNKCSKILFLLMINDNFYSLDLITNLYSNILNVKK